MLKGLFFFFGSISLQLSFQIKSVPITSEWVKISSSFGKNQNNGSQKLFNKMMCCSKPEHTRKQNFPYLLIEDYSGASSDNLEEQEEIICDYRREKNINICTDYRAAVIVHELTESQASALTEITPDYIHSYITATQSGQIFLL